MVTAPDKMSAEIDRDLLEDIQQLYDAIEGGGSAETDNDPQLHLRRKWTVDDDQAIFAGLRKHGCRWRAIARELKVGSDDAIRNRVLRMSIDDIPYDVVHVVNQAQLLKS